MFRFRAVLLLGTFVLAVGLLSGRSAWAQTGSITGQVLDQAGAVIPNATVTATSGSTGVSQTVTTSSAGLYNFATLPPALYTVTASATGFATVTKDHVTLNVAATLPLNFNLAVGPANTTVNVSGVTVAPIETQSYQLSNVIDAKQITNLPLVLRDPYQLVLLSSGAVTASNNDGGFAINGQRDRNNNFLLDGADNNDTSVPGIPGGLVSANPDSAQEFRVITNNFDAEFGRNTGAIVDVVTRGGTNRFHGGAYEFGRYNALGARDFFNTKANGPQDPYVRNDFGASLGGPIQKDKLFFFLNGEVQRFRTTRTVTQIVPNAAFKSGIFTYTDPIDGSQTPVNLTTPGNPNNFTGLTADPTIAKLLAITPPGQQETGDGVSSFLFFPSPDALNDYTLTGRLDYALSTKHQLTVRYTYGHLADTNPAHSEVLPGIGNYDNIQTAHNGVISLASTLSSNLTNLARAAYNQSNAGFFCQGFQGIDAITGLDSFGNGRDITLPYFGTGSNPLTYGCGVLGDSNGQARLSSTMLFGDTMTVVKGAHSVKFGGEFRNVKDSDYDDFFARDGIVLTNYSFYGAPAYNWNGDPNSPSFLGFQDMIWGTTGAVAEQTQNQFFTRQGVRQANDLTRFVQREWAIFAQDTWKITPRFTAIVGLRYEFNGVPFERDGNFANFYGNGSTVAPPQGFEFTAVGPGTGHQLYKDSWDLVEPRIGFAWDPHGDGRMAVRGGFGIFHDRLFDNLFGNAKSNPPFQGTFAAFPFDGTPATPVASTTPPPGTLTPSPFVQDGSFITPVVIDPNMKIPGSLTWNLGVQRELGRHLTGELNYVGSHSTHVLREVDTAPVQQGLVQQYLNEGVDPSALQRTALYTGGTDPVSGITFGPAVNNTAFDHILFQTAAASGNYNALQARVTELVGGLSLTAGYTYAHALDSGSDPLTPGAGNSGLPRDPLNLAAEYGNADYDVRHRGTVAATYDLPVGHGQRFLSSGFVGRVFEGIQISGIQQVQTGLPFDLRGTVDNLHTSLNNRPQLIGKPYPSGRGQIVAGGKITGPAASAFANAPFGEAVSIRRNKFYGPGFVNTDAVFQKTQQLHEDVKLILRVESYNLLNHPNLTSPSSLTLGSSTFGVSTSEVGQNDGTTGARQLQGAIKVVF
jgi:Carboxypeptidase regulatory-like domain/TonB dependent receptor